MNKVSYGAWGATIIWVSIIGWVTYTKRGDFSTMELNAVGDFLAGTVSPLALIWLVAGYLQQGKELKQNTEALMLQRQELKELVEANIKIANHAEAQAVASKALVELTEIEREEKIYKETDSFQPIFKFEEFTCYDRNAVYGIINTGKEAHRVEVTSPSFEDCRGDIPYQFLNGEKWTIAFEDLQSDWEFSDFIVQVKYIDIKGVVRVQQYHIKNGLSYFSASWKFDADQVVNIRQL